MNFREQAVGYLKRRDFPGLLGAARPAAVWRALFSLLYAADDLIHWRAVEALACAVDALAAERPEKGRDILRRLFWALNDESGGNARSVPEAIGAIISRRPGLYGDLASILLSYLDDPALRCGVLWAAAEIGRVRPALVSPAADKILSLLGDQSPAVRAHAARALRALNIKPPGEMASKLREDDSTACIYLDGKLKKVTVAEMAAGDAH